MQDNHFGVTPNNCHREPGVFEQVKTFLTAHPKHLVLIHHWRPTTNI